MDENKISQLCLECLKQRPSLVKRCTMGIGNYVYYVETTCEKYIVRCSAEAGAYKNTIHWLEKLSALRVPVPRVLSYGSFSEYEYLILSYIEGKDLGLVYPALTGNDKKSIAKEIVRIQDRAAQLKLEDLPAEWSWSSFVRYILDRAAERIAKNGYFDREKADRLKKEALQLDRYFSAIRPTAYLDDISSKNLIIHNGRVSGIIDVDWIGVGDKLTYVALTNMALLNLEYDTDYVTYILEEMALTPLQEKAFSFYSLLYCVDFMGERGMTFMGKTVEVNQQIIDRLNGIYDQLWAEWYNYTDV